MATIDLIVLGMIKQQPMSAYDIQKLVEYRKISEWVKISAPSIYKKVIQLEGKGYIKGEMIKEGNMAQKAVYSLTDSGEKEFEKLMIDIAAKPINIFLDLNAVIVNLDSLSAENRKRCLDSIEKSVKKMKAALEESIKIKDNNSDIPETGKAVLHQQLILAQAIETWLDSLK